MEEDGEITNALKTSWLIERPIAHRGLHDGNINVYENSLSAAKMAIAKGYAIEADLIPSSDGVPMVFHDQTLERLCGKKGEVRKLNADDLSRVSIGGTADTIPTLTRFLETVDGKVGLVLELKGLAGEDEGFVAAVLRALEGYSGDVAIMSFNHWLLADARRLVADVPVGLTAEGNENFYQVHQEADRSVAPDFLSYSVDDLPVRFVAEFRGSGRPVITWTVRDREQKAHSDRYADQITFEGFVP